MLKVSQQSRVETAMRCVMVVNNERICHLSAKQGTVYTLNAPCAVCTAVAALTEGQ
jgi:hypothetical protein